MRTRYGLDIKNAFLPRFSGLAICGTLALTVTMAALATPALAYDHHHRHGGGWGWGWGLGAGFATGLAIDAAWGWPHYYYPYAAYPYPTYTYPAYAYPTAVVPAPVTVAPPTAVQAAPAPQAMYYYCDNPQGYYPYVAACPTAWRAVPATPPGATR